MASPCGRSFWVPVLLTTLVAALFGAVLARRGRQLEAMLIEEARMQARLEALKAKNEQARAERDALLSSPEAVEAIARQEYGFATPGEKVAPYDGHAGGFAPMPAAVIRASAWQRVLMWRLLPLLVTGLAFAVTALVFALLRAVSRRSALAEDGRASVSVADGAGGSAGRALGR